MGSRSKYELDYSGFDFDKYYRIKSQIPSKPAVPNLNQMAYANLTDFSNALMKYNVGVQAYNNMINLLKSRADTFYTDIQNNIKKIDTANDKIQKIIDKYENAKVILNNASFTANSFCYNFASAKGVLFNAYKNDSGSRISSIQGAIRREDVSKLKSEINTVKSDIEKRKNVLKSVKTQNSYYKINFEKASSEVKNTRNLLDSLSAETVSV